MDTFLMCSYTALIRKLQVTHVTFKLDSLVHSFYMVSRGALLSKYLVTLLTFISKLFMYYLDMATKALSVGELFFASLAVKCHSIMMH